MKKGGDDVSETEAPPCDCQGNHVMGDKGAYVAGQWADIEQCDQLFNIKNGSASKNCAACPRSRSRNTSTKPSGAYDVCVIGAGCIGAAICRELSKSTASVLLVEAADDVTQGATKGNSGIVHAGYDDKPGSVKAKYCWAGNQLFAQLDRELHFGFQRNGSLVVAKTTDDLKVLDELVERGKKNGVGNLRIVGQEELRSMEPHISDEAIAALHSPDAGTITPYEYTIALAENAVDNGVELRIRRQVVAIEQTGAAVGGEGRFKITVKHWEPEVVARRAMARASRKRAMLLAAGGAAVAAAVAAAGSAASSGSWVFGGVVAMAVALSTLALYTSDWLAAPEFERWQYSPSKGTVLEGLATTEIVRCDFIVNAAGCSSDKIAAMVGDTSFQIKPRTGDYILLHKDEGFKANHTLFPTPHPFFGKGVLVQGTLWGNLILGPTARDTLMKDERSGKYVVDPSVRDEKADDILGYILSKCRLLIPSFDATKVIHTFCGARAKNTTGDWIIGPVGGVGGFINCAGIDSPGIAASPAIAIDVCRMLAQAGAPVTARDASFNPNRAPIITVKNGLRGLRFSKSSEPFKVADPKRNVVCKCERVTEQEIVDACRRSLPVDSTQAMRKRTRAGMGHCQGDPSNYDCESRVAAIIARETGLSIDEVGRRPWPASSLMPSRLYSDEDRARLDRLSDPSRTYKLHGAAT